MEGLEILEANLSNTILNRDFRIDSDFWTKEPFKNPKLEYKRIGDILKNAQYGISVPMNESELGYPIFRMNEIHNMMTDLEVDKCADISKSDFEKFKLKDKDVLFNRTNSYEWVGRTGIYRQIGDKEFTFASYLVRFIPDETVVKPEYLTAFLNSKFGIRDIKRRSRHSVNQTNVNPEEVKEINIPILKKTIQIKIVDCFEIAHNYHVQSKDLYNKAETLLLDALIIKDFQPSNDPVNIKSFKESFLRTGRLDAEYYQKKYEEVVKHITKQNHDSLANIVTIKKSIEPGSDAYSDEGLPFLRVSDYNKFEIRTPEKKLSIDFCNENEELLNTLKPTKNTILFSKDGSVGNAHLLRENADFVTSGAVLHMSIKQTQKVIPEYLTLVLNSELVQMQAERDSGGSVILHWRLEEIESVVVPIIEYSLQKKIATLIEESFRLKIESMQLLETAKRAVEIAIEEDEHVAIKYIEEKVNTINTLKNDH